MSLADSTTRSAIPLASTAVCASAYPIMPQASAPPSASSSDERCMASLTNFAPTSPTFFASLRDPPLHVAYTLSTPTPKASLRVSSSRQSRPRQRHTRRAAAGLQVPLRLLPWQPIHKRKGHLVNTDRCAVRLLCLRDRVLIERVVFASPRIRTFTGRSTLDGGFVEAMKEPSGWIESSLPSAYAEAGRRCLVARMHRGRLKGRPLCID